MSRKRNLDSEPEDEEEEPLDVYHYIAVTGGQAWGRHPGEEGRVFPYEIPEGIDRPSTQRYYDYWMNLYTQRIAERRNARLEPDDLEPSTDLERAVLEAGFRSSLEEPAIPSAEVRSATNVTERAVAHFRQVAQDQQRAAAAAFLAQERARKRSTPSPAPTTPGLPPRTPGRPPTVPGRPPTASLPRGAARAFGQVTGDARNTQLARAVREVGIAAGQGTDAAAHGLMGQLGGLTIGRRDQGAAAAAGGGLASQLEGLSLEDPDGARNRFGRALRNPNLSSHKRKKYTKLYYALAFL
jgi:hypothetical protein